jgi:hypothetical protein
MKAHNTLSFTFDPNRIVRGKIPENTNPSCFVKNPNRDNKTAIEKTIRFLFSGN